MLSVAALLPMSPAAAHESEQYSLPIGRDFADLGPYLTRIVHGAIVDAVAQTNDAIAEAIANGEPPGRIEELQSGIHIASKVWEFIFVAVPANELLDLALASEPVKARYPGLVTMYRPPVSIYDDALLVVDPTKAVRTFFRAGSISAGGVLFGTDKLIHFINVGRIYHAKYASRIERGLTEEAAMRSAIASTSRNPLTSEDGVLGMLSTGIYSNGDLAADYAGLLFYRNLAEPVRIGPRTLPPMLERDGPYWRVAVKPDSDFFTAFVTPHWNEVLNPSRFARYTAGRIRSLVAERCPDAIDWYRDRHGRQRTQAEFEAIARELSTYFGGDYGHKANRNNRVTVAGVCFPGDGGTAKASGAGAPQVDGFGRTGLWWAARTGHAGLVRELASAGDDVDAADIDGETPLHAAARAASAASAGELLSRGADPNRAALYGVAPLMLAASSGRTEVGLVLVRAGADPNARDLFGRTALHAAVERGDAVLARALLEGGAEPWLADDAGNTLLRLALARGDEAIAELLEQHAATAAQGVGAVVAGDLAAGSGGGQVSPPSSGPDFASVRQAKPSGAAADGRVGPHR
jgi:ankyrin repeat protein